MTIIVGGIATSKKHLAELVKFTSATGSRVQVHFKDPTIFNPLHGGATFSLFDMEIGERFVCTNHPKRSWFAEVERLGAHAWRVR